MIQTAANGVSKIPSMHSVDETIRRATEIVAAKGLSVFALIDHSGEARRVGLQMPETKLLIFGSASGGTPMMLASPGIALDLPLKLLVSEGSNGEVWVSYNSPGYLQERHAMPMELFGRLSVVEMVAAAAANAPAETSEGESPVSQP